MVEMRALWEPLFPVHQGLLVGARAPVCIIDDLQCHQRGSSM